MLKQNESFYVFDWGKKYFGKKIEDISLLQLDSLLGWIEDKKQENGGVLYGKMAIAEKKIKEWLKINENELNYEWEGYYPEPDGVYDVNY